MPYQPGAMPPPEPVYTTGPTGYIQPLGGLATAASIMLGFASALSLFSAFAFFQRASVADKFMSSGSLSELDSADTVVAAASLILGLLVLATGIVFIIWQHRFASNAVALGGPLGLAPGWAIGGWFIPLANFVLPQLQLCQSAKASRGKVPGVVTAWWITYVTGALTVAVSSLSRPKTATVFGNLHNVLGDFARADRIAAVGILVYAAAGVCALLMVRSLTVQQQEAAAARQQPPQWDQPPPQPYL